MEKKSLVIVESPSKAKTINKILGKNFVVKASVGHIKNLPPRKLGVDVDNDFKLEYVLISGKDKVVNELKKEAQKADKVFLAPDPDREGEAIAWHIAEELDGAKAKIYRVTFHEITKKAVLDAVQNAGAINMGRVQSQQARRALDRLVGYKLSPLLWKKITRGLSAGRVQSVALRLIVDREKEIQDFKSIEFWHITVELEAKEKPTFSAKLAKIHGKKANLENEEQTKIILNDLEGKSYIVEKIDKKSRKRSPSPPFTTSTLQQEAARKLRFSAKKTMMNAQKLYEGIELGSEGAIGLITYMRTDSVRVAAEAQEEARAYIHAQFGEKYVPKKPNFYKSKSSAQEGHEAVRPTSVLRTPDSIKQFLTPEQYKLYLLIWNRFVSSQMSPADLEVTTVDVKAGDYTFRASGTVIKFKGFMTIYMEDIDDKPDSDKDDAILPKMTEQEALKLLNIAPSQHFTQPPPRYTEASLVKELDAKGIGRPSTYALILSTLEERKYVQKVDRKLIPSELGVAVTHYLIKQFPELMDVGFTAKMEEKLDSIEDGKHQWTEVLRDFYTPFNSDLAKALNDKEKLQPDSPETDEVCDKCNSPMVIKWGRFGKFLSCTGYPKCKNAKPLNNKENGQVGAEPPQETGEKCPNCGSPMVFKKGRYGQFVACSSYPKCKTTKAASTGVKCPEDGGDIVVKRSKAGRMFYGCQNYPNCTFVTWQKPVQKACPQCNAPFLTEKKSKKDGLSLVCLSKECAYQEAVKSEEEIANN